MQQSKHGHVEVVQLLVLKKCIEVEQCFASC